MGKYDLRIEYETFVEPVRQLKKERIIELGEFVLNLRKDFKLGKIDNLTYQRQVRPINKELKKLGKDIEIDTDKIFVDCFVDFKNTPLGLISQISVVEYLRM